MAKNGSSEVSLLAGIIVGAAAGAVLGLLFAPDKGSKTRKKIKKKSEEFKNLANEKLEDLSIEAKQRMNEISEQAKHKYEDLSTTFKEKANDLAHNVKDKYIKGKSNIQEVAQNVQDDIDTELDALR